MDKDKKKQSFWSIRNKIILIIYIIMFPVLIISGVFMYTGNAGAVQAENTRQYQTSVDVLNDSVSYFEQDLQDIFNYVIVNEDVAGVLRSPVSLGSNDPLFWKTLSPMNFVTGMLNVKGNIRTFILYPENSLVPFYVSQDGSVMNKSIEEIRMLDIYRRAVEAQGDTVWERVPAGISGLFDKNKYDKIVLAREIFDASKQIRLGFMALSIDVAQYEQILQSSLLYAYDGIVMVDSDFSPIAHTGVINEDTLAQIEQLQLSQTPLAASGTAQAVGDHYIFVAPRGMDGWIYYFSPKAEWDAKIAKGLTQPFVLGLALLVSVLPISLMASRIISRPLTKLYASMNRFKGGDFSQQVQVSGNDEISALSETFNTMVRDIKDLIDRNYVMVLREKESELNALQAQINPHFLYNALDSLYWQASDNSQEDLAEDILSLSELFRLVLSSGQSEITVRQEISLVSHYLRIQKMRFSQKLDYSVTVAEEMLEYPISKLILQPFVENAIVHGLERLDSWGCVQVRGEMQGGMMHFIVEDNGTGMPMEKVEEILFADEDSRYANQRIGHYAIRNVKERMSLRYGDRAKLEIQSTVGVGTRVSIHIPAEAEQNNT